MKKKRARPAKESTHTPSATGTAVVYITGESPMVETYAEICAARQYAVVVHWNHPPAEQHSFTSANIKVSAVVPTNTSVGLELTNTDTVAKRANMEKLDKALPPSAPLLTSSVTTSATEQSGWVRHKHRLAGMCALPTFLEAPLVEVAPTVHSPKETLEVVARFFTSIGKEIELVQDRVGMVLPRIVCQLINESAFALTEEVASPRDIDTAMKLGVNYPIGPVEWAGRIGIRQVYAVLTALESDLREDRYRISPLLRQMALAGEWWKEN